MLGLFGDIAQPEQVGVLLLEGDRIEDLLHGFCAEAGQVRYFAGLAYLLQVLDRSDAECVVERFDFFRSEAADAEQVEYAFREFAAKFVVKLELTRRRQLVKFVGKGCADALDAFEILLLRLLDNVPGVGFDHLGTGAVGADLKRVLALQLEEEGDAIESFDDAVAGGHWMNGQIVGRATALCKPKCEEKFP